MQECCFYMGSVATGALMKEHKSQVFEAGINIFITP